VGLDLRGLLQDHEQKRTPEILPGAKIFIIEKVLDIRQSYYKVDALHEADFTANQVEETPKEEAQAIAIANTASTSPAVHHIFSHGEGLAIGGHEDATTTG